MRIAIIAHHVAPIRPPFVGGVESHTWYLARWLARRGHDVTLFALPGSEVPGVRIATLNARDASISEAARQDVSSMPSDFLSAHHGYLQLMVELAGRSDFDAIHVNTLHYLPVAMARTLPVRPVLTLHCPPTPWLESALRVAGKHGDTGLEIAAVSDATASAWSEVVPGARVIVNGVDPQSWLPGPGGADCAWIGRIVPEKAPHLAIDAAKRSGRALRLAGPIVDRGYFTREVEPRLGGGADYMGHLDHRDVAQLLGSSAVALQSPMWDEPFGLAAAEAMACGTPVAAFARGGLVPLVGADGGALAAPGDVEALAQAIERASLLDRTAVRAAAIARAGVDAMAGDYEALYQRLARPRRAAERAEILPSEPVQPLSAAA